MKVSLEKLTEEALALPAEARAMLADRLTDSLDPFSAEEGRVHWTVEALRRRAELMENKVKPIPAAKALAHVRKSLPG